MTSSLPQALGSFLPDVTPSHSPGAWAHLSPTDILWPQENWDPVSGQSLFLFLTHHRWSTLKHLKQNKTNTLHKPYQKGKFQSIRVRCNCVSAPWGQNVFAGIYLISLSACPPVAVANFPSLPANILTKSRTLLSSQSLPHLRTMWWMSWTVDLPWAQASDYAYSEHSTMALQTFLHTWKMTFRKGHVRIVLSL